MVSGLSRSGQSAVALATSVTVNDDAEHIEDRVTVAVKRRAREFRPVASVCRFHNSPSSANEILPQRLIVSMSQIYSLNTPGIVLVNNCLG